jgi:hypothetical protein
MPSAKLELQMAGIKDLPEDHWIRLAHNKSATNRRDIEKSTICGCFYCRQTFVPAKIKEWIDEADQTALCPFCGIDSVIGDRSGFEITEEFLRVMREFWFSIVE